MVYYTNTLGDTMVKLVYNRTSKQYIMAFPKTLVGFLGLGPGDEFKLEQYNTNERYGINDIVLRRVVK